MLYSLLATSAMSLLATQVSASPIQRRADLTIQDTDVSTWALYAQYAGAAYCNSDGDDVLPGATLSCSEDVCPAATEAGSTIVSTLGTDDLKSRTGLTGYVALDPAQQTIVVAYRGSASIRNWLSDLNAVVAKCSERFGTDLATQLPDGCRVHDGFASAWGEVRDDTYRVLAEAQEANPAFSVVVTGHSLGAAVATIAAAELRARGVALALYTYGSPRIGNEDLVAFLSTQTPFLGLVANHRFTHEADPVPRLPPRLLLDYRHTSPEFWLGEGTAVADSSVISYTPAEIKVCTGYASSACNAGQLAIEFKDHSKYFEAISACDPDGLEFR